MALETVLGTSSVHPLVHVTTVYPIDQSITNGISKAVNSRLEETYGKSLQIMKRFEADVSKIATRLVTYETLDKVELSNYLTSIEGPESL
ncbi:MAG: hypothetical protein AAAC48_06395 [Phyllobacterium sp.]|uniref:hypothetical protein n=1 Tax=Phyllobacterium sp. TaxID=1871046 RepID=UPI0030F006D3